MGRKLKKRGIVVPAGLNYKAIAERTGVSRPHVSRIYRGLAAPSVDVLKKLAMDRGITTDALLDELANLK